MNLLIAKRLRFVSMGIFFLVVSSWFLFISMNLLMHDCIAPHFVLGAEVGDEESYPVSSCNETSSWDGNYPPVGYVISITSESKEGESAINYSLATSIYGDATFYYDLPEALNWSSMDYVSVYLRYDISGVVRVMIFDSQGKYRHWDFPLAANLWTKEVLYFSDFTADNGIDLSNVTRVQFGCQGLSGQHLQLFVDDLRVGKEPRVNLCVRVIDYIGFPISNSPVALYFQNKLILSQNTNTSGWISVPNARKGTYLVKTSLLFLEWSSELMVDSEKPLVIALPLFYVSSMIVFLGVATTLLIYKKRNFVLSLIHTQIPIRENYQAFVFLICILIIGGSILIGWNFITEIISVFLFAYLIMLIIYVFFRHSRKGFASKKRSGSFDQRETEACAKAEFAQSLPMERTNFVYGKAS